MNRRICAFFVVFITLFFCVTCSQYDKDTLLNISANLAKIEITSEPARKIYYVNDVMTTSDLAGLEVTAIYSDASRKIIPLDDLEFIGFDSTEAMEEQTVIIAYEGQTASFAISINPLVLTEIKIVKQPNRTIYLIDDTSEDIDLTGIEVIAFYNNDTSSPIPITIDDIIGFDSSKPAEEQALTVIYQDKIDTFSISIEDGFINRIRVTKRPTRTIYYVDNILTNTDLAGLEAR